MVSSTFVVLFGLLSSGCAAYNAPEVTSHFADHLNSSTCSALAVYAPFIPTCRPVPSTRVTDPMPEEASIVPQPSEHHAIVPYSPETSSEAYPIDPSIASPQVVASESKVCKFLDWQFTSEILACVALALTASIVFAVISLFLIDIYVDGGIDGLADRLLLQLEDTAVAAGEMSDTATEGSVSVTQEHNDETDAESCRTEAHC